MIDWKKWIKKSDIALLQHVKAWVLGSLVIEGHDIGLGGGTVVVTYAPLKETSCPHFSPQLGSKYFK